MEDILDADSGPGPENYDGPSLDQLHHQGYQFDFGACFELGWKAFSKDIGSFILYTLVFFLLAFVSAFTIIGLLIIALPLTAGFMIYGSKLLKGEPVEFNDFFGGFKYTGSLFGYLMLCVLAALIFFVPVGLLMGFNFSVLESGDPLEVQQFIYGAMMPFQLVSWVIGLFMQTILIFVVPLIVLGQLGTMDAIKWSARIALKNFWWLLLYSFVVSIVSQAGVFACYIGILFTLPLSQCLSLGCYAHIVGLAEKRTTIVG